MFDITAVGELLIDFTPAGVSDAGDPLFAQKPGGAPANVLAANSRLGGHNAFIGKVGNDGFGDFLRGTLEKLRIDVSGLCTDPEIPTTLAFVQLDRNGDRSFSFYRKPGADLMLRSSEINDSLISGCRILHFGSVSMTGEPSRSATLSAVRAARKLGRIISYDPNYRPPLWENAGTAKEQMTAGLELADIIKVSEEEMALLTGESNLEKGSAALARFGASLVFISLGAGGAFYRSGDLCGALPAYGVKTIDTNGAGDAFLGAALFRLRGKTLEEIRSLKEAELKDILLFANAAGALTTVKNGAIPAMPSLEEIRSCMETVPFLPRGCASSICRSY
ncbi:carbohydrate kinase [Caproiciproducens sp. NJN-50]|uniref:carbohydrate kinase family protein n=1 Tax=Acutalibacteraceae TaxID=3082771 RepID=UPI000FFE1566|nr:MULTISPECIES: carbohydrate kinase [Acutalibacteraceae]QAT50308.1 carbohydrate kinase [Caproiciproducens sp. NJN-50]